MGRAVTQELGKDAFVTSFGRVYENMHVNKAFRASFGKMLTSRGLSKYRKDTQTTQRHTKTRKDGQRRAKTRKDTQRHAKAAKKNPLKLTKTHKDGQRHAKICVSLHVFACLCATLRVFA